MATTDKTLTVLELARRGPLRARDLDERGVPRAYLRRLCQRGELEQVDRGLYRLPDAPVTEAHALALVAKRVPHATVCLLSALQFHELTTELPSAVWIMVDRAARSPSLRYPRLEVVRASGAARTFGIEHERIEGVDVAITTPAKTVADCFRYRRHVGLDVALDALRDFIARGSGKPTRREREALGRGDGFGDGGASRFGEASGDGCGDPAVYSMDTLVAAARADRVFNVMRPYMEALV